MAMPATIVHIATPAIIHNKFFIFRAKILKIQSPEL
jgi:hypothetical protein